MCKIHFQPATTSIEIRRNDEWVGRIDKTWLPASSGLASRRPGQYRFQVTLGPGVFRELRSFPTLTAAKAYVRTALEALR